MMKNKYGEIRSGWTVALSLAVMLLLQLVAGVAVSAVTAYQMMASGQGAILENMEAYTQHVMGIASSPGFNVVLLTATVGALLLLFWLIYKRPIKQMGLYTKGWALHLGGGGLLGAVSMALAVGLLLLLGAVRVGDFNAAGALGAVFWAGLAHYICVGFNEEILSRGLMMTALKTTRRPWLIILLPAVIFGLLHFFNNHFTFFSCLNIALVGVLFAYLFIKTGRLWAPIGYHITWNFFQGFVFGIPVSGTDIPQAPITRTVFTGPEWLTGGAFGLEGGAMCTLVILLGLLYIHFCVKPPAQPEDFWRMDGDLPLTRGARVPAQTPAPTDVTD